MLTIAALILNTLWHLEDSYREEQKYYHQHRHQHLSKGNASAAILSKPDYYRSKNRRINSQTRNNDSTMMTQNVRVRFYEVGNSEEESSDISSAQEQTECA